MLERLTKIIEHTSVEELEWEGSVKNLGGRSKVLGNDELLTAIALEIENSQFSGATAKMGPKEKGEAKDKDADGGKSKDPEATGKAEDSRAKSRKLRFDASNVLTQKERRELRMPLQEIIKSNFALYEGKLEAQLQIISEEVRQSTQRILQRLEAGAHERIFHPHIQQIWKDMVSSHPRMSSQCFTNIELIITPQGWRSSVKSRTFVLAVHDFYVDRYAQAFMLRREVASTNSATLTVKVPIDDGNLSPGSSRPSTPVDSEVGHMHVHNSDDEMTPEEVEEALADKWCLQYLNVSHAYSVMEAIDDDDSGYIRASEINDFTSAIPTNWTLLQWLAFWARGWKQQTSIYARSINEVIEMIKRLSFTVLVENNQLATTYLRSFDFSLERLTYAATTNTPPVSDSPLDGLVTKSMAYKEKKLERALQRLYYTVDAPESLRLICGPGRMEKVRMFIIS